MKFLFLAILGVLLLASAGTYLAAPDTFSPVPVISWVTDKNPAREKQVETFEQWLVDNGLTDGTKTDGTPRPGAKLVLDLANRDETKQIMQGVSGVGGDVMDLGGANLGYFHAIGLVRDVTDAAQKLGYGPDQTWPAIVPDLTQGGRQYVFPCNVGIRLYWVNKATFAKYGQPVPPRRWTLGGVRAPRQAIRRGSQCGQPARARLLLLRRRPDPARPRHGPGAVQRDRHRVRDGRPALRPVAAVPATTGPSATACCRAGRTWRVLIRSRGMPARCCNCSIGGTWRCSRWGGGR